MPVRTRVEEIVLITALFLIFLLRYYIFHVPFVRSIAYISKEDSGGDYFSFY